MGLIHGGWLVAKTLKREGVEVVFTSVAGILPVFTTVVCVKAFAL